MTLADLKNGESGVITQMSECQRFGEMGFVRGKAIKKLFAPFGDPIVFSVVETSIAIRKSDAQSIECKREARGAIGSADPLHG